MLVTGMYWWLRLSKLEGLTYPFILRYLRAYVSCSECAIWSFLVFPLKHTFIVFLLVVATAKV